LQPNFDEVSGHFQSLSEQFGRARNIPAFDQGHGVLQALHDIVRRLDQIDQRIDQIQSSLNDIHIGNTARDINQCISAENSLLVKDSDELKPLYSLTTGELIDSFPRLVGDISSLPSAEVNRVLAQLKLPLTGNVRERRRTLFFACGVRFLGI